MINSKLQVDKFHQIHATKKIYSVSGLFKIKIYSVKLYTRNLVETRNNKEIMYKTFLSSILLLLCNAFLNFAMTRVIRFLVMGNI